MNYPQGCNEDIAAPWNDFYQPREFISVEVEVHYKGPEDENFQTVLFTVEVEDKKAEIAREAKDWCRHKGLVYIDWFLTGVKE